MEEIKGEINKRKGCKCRYKEHIKIHKRMHEWANASVVFLTGEKDKRKIKKLNARIYLIRLKGAIL